MITTAHSVPTFYQDMGTGQPVVFLHGWGQDWQSWYPIIQALSEKYRLILVDLPGFGKSQSSQIHNWVLADYARWLDEFCKLVVDKKKYTVVGHSFGGKVAAYWAGSTQPANLCQLILVAASGFPDEMTTQTKLGHGVVKIIPEPIKQAMPHRFKTKVLGWLGLSTDHLNSTPTQRQVLRKTLHVDVSAQLRQIKNPTTLIWGRDDEITPLREANRYQQLLPSAEMKIINQAGHFVFVDQPHQFVKEITASLQQHRS